MAFVDEVTIRAMAGRGGDGVVRWLRTKGKEKGGPAGGDGGRGGDVVLQGVHDLAALSRYRFEKTFRAKNGDAGGNENRHGADGEAVILRVPVGTVATDETIDKSVEILQEGERIVFYTGGGGGKGNAHFKGSTNQNPFEQTSGKEGGAGNIVLTLKLIADAGLIGLPNAGKSSLLNALTRAKSKVGAYPFTTLEPYLGDFYGRIFADIPGLIEGASEGRGLGSRFLKHIERTGFLIHLVSAEQEDPAATYRGVRAELSAFGRGLPEKEEIVVLSKADLLSEEKRRNALAALTQEAGKEAVPVSVVDENLLKSFSDFLATRLTARVKG